MVFWSDVAVEPADPAALLSLLGPRLADPQVLDALGVGSLPAEDAAVALPDGGFLRQNARLRRRAGPGGAARSGRPVAPATQSTRASWPAGVWAYEAHRVAALRPRLGIDTDERTIPHEVGWTGTAVHLDKGCYRGQETVARVHNLGNRPDAGAGAPGRLRAIGRPPAIPLLAGGRTCRPVGHGGRPCRRGPHRPGAAQAWPARRHAVDHRRGQRRSPRSSTRTRCHPPTGSVPAGWRWNSCAAERVERNGPASTRQPGTVKCWQDNKRHQIGAA